MKSLAIYILCHNRPDDAKLAILSALAQTDSNYDLIVSDNSSHDDVERMVQHVRQHCGAEPACYMTGGAGWKMAPSMSVQFELVDSLIFDGLLEIAKHRLDHPAPVWPSRGLY